MDGLAVAASRAAVEQVLKDHKLFSAEGLVNLGNVRPLIPLSVDPPRHSRYRKILDPLFAPRRMDALEDDIAARFNRFVDEFIDRGACHFTDELATPFPSAIFLGLMGLPWDELDTLFQKVSNWGRWGDDDQRGALNLITPAKRQQAAALRSRADTRRECLAPRG